MPDTTRRRGTEWTLWDQVQRAIQALRTATAQREAAHRTDSELDALSERDLADIGLKPKGINAVVRLETERW